MTLRQEKVSNFIREAAANYLKSEVNNTSLVTVTHADVSSDMKKATIFVTVFPENKEKEALDFLKRKRTDLRNYVKKNIKTKVIPFFDFEIDFGEKNRQLIDQLLIQK